MAAASEDWVHEEEMPIDERLKVLAAAAGEPKRKRARPCDVAIAGGDAASGGARVDREEHSSGAAAAAEASRVQPESAAAAAAIVAVEDTDALDCGVCFLPLKPPIFQCDVGHVVCSPCHDKLQATGSCYVCSGATTGGYRRCYAMERMVEAVRVPCPNAAYGCYARPAYHDQQAHREMCAHAPCSYLGNKGCGFIGSTEAVMDHFTSASDCPLTMKIRADNLGMHSVGLNDDFNFLADSTTEDQGECYMNQILTDISTTTSTQTPFCDFEVWNVFAPNEGGFSS